MKLTLSALLIALFVQLGFLMTGYDRWTTIGPDTLLTRAITMTLAAITLVVVLVSLCRPGSGSAKLQALRRDRPPVGFAAIILIAGLLAAGTFWVSRSLLHALAQHIEGADREFVARITDVDRIQSRKGVCLVEVTIEEGKGGPTQSLCTRARNGAPLGPDDLHLDDEVRVGVRETSLGIVVTSLSRISGP